MSRSISIGGRMDFIRRNDNNKEGVRKFLAKLFSEVPHAPSEIVVVFDNHSSHHSRYVQDYMRYMKSHSLFTAPYSSRLNNVEFVWSMLKKSWSTLVSRITTEYNHENITRDVELTAKSIGTRLTPAILQATDKLYY